MFELIKNIDIKDPNSWQNKIFLTFDIDWCSDEVLEYTLDILEEYNIKATFFVTHKTKLLERMRQNKNIELGIHPNFNFLLNGDFRYGKNIDEIIEYYKDIIPEAVSVRSHSLTQSSVIISKFYERGFVNHCNTYIPHNSGIILFPYKLWNGMNEVPFFWEDDIHCMYKWKFDINEAFYNKGLKIYNFHPIHTFLNTEKLDKYENARPYLQDFKKLKEFVNNKTYGTRDFLIDLIVYDGKA